MHLQLAFSRMLHLQFGNGPYRLQLEWSHRRWLFIRVPFVGEGCWSTASNYVVIDWKELRAGELAGCPAVEDV